MLRKRKTSTQDSEYAPSTSRRNDEISLAETIKMKFKKLIVNKNPYPTSTENLSKNNFKIMKKT